jgi:lysophospholipase L1-like esterase
MAQILAFGDSITDGAFDTEGGWANRLHRYFMSENIKDDLAGDENHWLYNLGISGDLTEDLLDRIEVESKARKIDRPDKESAFIFAIGTNDSCAKDTADNYRSSPVEFKDNMSKLVKFAKRYTNKIIIVGLLPVDENCTQPIYGKYWYCNDRISQFNKVAKQLASNEGVGFIDLFTDFQKIQGTGSYLIDGIHPNTRGHEWIYEQIKPEVVRAVSS